MANDIQFERSTERPDKWGHRRGTRRLSELTKAFLDTATKGGSICVKREDYTAALNRLGQTARRRGLTACGRRTADYAYFWAEQKEEQ